MADTHTAVVVDRSTLLITLAKCGTPAEPKDGNVDNNDKAEGGEEEEEEEEEEERRGGGDARVRGPKAHQKGRRQRRQKAEENEEEQDNQEGEGEAEEEDMQVRGLESGSKE